MKSAIFLILSMVAPAGSAAYMFAPVQKPVSGTPTLSCIGIKYQDLDRHTSGGEASSMCHQIEDFYRRNSRGALQFKTAGYQVNVPLDGGHHSVNQAERLAIAAHPNSDMYAIVTMFINTSHAGAGVAHLGTALASTATHEVGHLLGLGHAGRYELEAGKWHLDAYGDGQSVMSRYPSAWLTAPQYYHQGWLPKEEAALYVAGQTYELKRINDFDGPGLATVIVDSSLFQPNVDAIADTAKGKARDAFISFPTGCKGGCVAIHLANDGGSQKVKTFGHEYYDERFTGLHVKVIAAVGNLISISVDFDKKPAGVVDPADID